jgi:hypothetical protein
MLVFGKGFTLPVVACEEDSIPVGKGSHCTKGAVASAEAMAGLQEWDESLSLGFEDHVHPKFNYGVCALLGKSDVRPHFFFVAVAELAAGD